MVWNAATIDWGLLDCLLDLVFSQRMRHSNLEFLTMVPIFVTTRTVVRDTVIVDALLRTVLRDRPAIVLLLEIHKLLPSFLDLLFLGQIPPPRALISFGSRKRSCPQPLPLTPTISAMHDNALVGVGLLSQRSNWSFVESKTRDRSSEAVYPYESSFSGSILTSSILLFVASLIHPL